MFYPRCFVSETNSNAKVCIRGRECFFSDSSSNNCFYEIPCEEILKYMVIEDKPRTTKDILVLLEEKCMVLNKGTELEAIEIIASQVRVIVKEGEKIRKWQPIAYSLSKKGVLRKIKSHKDGILFLSYWDPVSKPSKTIVFLTDENQVKIYERKQ